VLVYKQKCPVTLQYSLLCEDDFTKLDVTKVPRLALVESIEAGYFKEMESLQLQAFSRNKKKPFLQFKTFLSK